MSVTFQASCSRYLQLASLILHSHKTPWRAVGLLTLLSVASLSFGVTAHAQEELILDGNFENAPVSIWSGKQVIFASQSLGPWDVSYHGVDALGSILSDNPRPGSAIDLTSDWSLQGGIHQTIDTQVGTTYLLKYTFAGSFHRGNAVSHMTVSAGGESRSVSVNRPGNWSWSNVGWQTGEMTFTATEARTTIAFKSDSKHSMIVDAVSVTAQSGAATENAPAAENAPERQAAIDAILASNSRLRYEPVSDKFFEAKWGIYSWDVAMRDAGNIHVHGIQGVAGRFASIRSAEENAVAAQLAAWGGQNLLIAGSDKDQEGIFSWYQSGSATGSIAYSNWATGEPNNYNNEDYIEIYSDGRWNDTNSAKAYLVEWDAADIVGPRGPEVIPPPPALDKVPVPLPDDLDSFVKDRHKATLLGKALFWDMQVGSDGRTACATCHFAAGIDIRTKNVVNPGAPGSAFGPQNDESRRLRQEALAQFEGPNEEFDAAEFPHAKLEHPTRSIFHNTLVEDSKEVYGSQGVVRKDFLRIVEGSPVDEGRLVADPVFNINGANARQVTGRNTPSTINAVFHDRLFWDGRANHFFNGINEFGDLDPNARVLKKVISTQSTTTYQWVWKTPYLWASWYGYWAYEPTTTTTTVEKLEPTKILLNNAALASQAVGPPLSDVEMSWHGRDFKQVGRKMLALRPLALQNVHPDDSVLGPFAASGTGLHTYGDYAALVRESFHDEWWSSSKLSVSGRTQMEENFSLFWGLSLLMYQSTLVSDQSPYDHYANGNESALSESAKRGLSLFMDHCASCHEGSEFAGATVSDLRRNSDGVDTNPDLVEFMVMGDKNNAHYDNGFYNIGVRPTNEDIGVGAAHPEFGPLSYSRQRANGRDIGQDINVSGRIAVNGAFKTNTVRNIELTGPFFHTGGYRTLREVVEFYTRGGTFFRENIADIDPDVDGISELQDNPEKIDDVVEFMRHLTDERVRRNQAPFDHPQLILPNGHNGTNHGIATDDLIVIPAVGRNGGAPLQSFEERVQ